MRSRRLGRAALLSALLALAASLPAPAAAAAPRIDAAAAIVDRFAQSIASAVRYEKISAIKRPNGEILVKLADVETWSRIAPRHANKARFTRVSLASGKTLPTIGDGPVPAPEPPETEPAPEPSVEIDAKAFLEATRLSAEALVEISATLKTIAELLSRERKEF